MKCHYCENEATKNVVWLKDKRRQPARIVLPWCGCDLMTAIRRIWASPYQVVEGVDYAVETLAPPPTRRGLADEGRAAEPTGWQPIETAPKNGREVLLAVKSRAGIPGCCLVGHYQRGGHCIEDHPPIDEGWYFWNGLMFDRAAEPTHWMPLPTLPTKGC